MTYAKKRKRKLMRNMRFNLILFFVLIGIGIFSFHMVKEVLLKSSQDLGSALAANCASEMQNQLTVYETLLNFGEDQADRQENTSTEQIEAWLQMYFVWLQRVLGSDIVDPYAIVDGKIVAANPWEGDDTYDFESSEWYQKAAASPGETIFTDVYRDVIYDRSVITIAQKSPSQEDDIVIAFDIFPENFQFRETALDEQEGGSFFLCDGNGQIIYSETDWTGPEEELSQYILGVLASIERGEQDSYDSSITDLDGKQRGVYYTWMPNGWISIITIPYSSILWYLRQFFAGFCLVFLLLVLILAVITWREYRFYKKIERTDETVRVLGNSYYAIYRINYGDDTYEMIKGSDYIRSRIPAAGPYSELLTVMTEVIEEEAKEEYLASFSTENIRKLVSRRIKDFGGDFLRKFGEEYRWVNVRILFDESLAPDEVVLCFSEVDQEKRSQLQERKLLKNSLEMSRQSQQSKQAFFSSMSHDMRTPLNAILGLSELAEREVENPGKVKGYLEKILFSGRQLLELINDILDMSRMEQGKMEINTQRFNLKRCIQDCADNFRFQAEREEKNFQVSFELDTAYVMGDPMRITQIVNNLLSNAFKFTSPGDSVSVSVSEVENQEFGKYRIAVSDTGTGMSEEFLSQVFDPYARETRFGAKKVAGTGLGMAIVKNLVEQMNGHITVASSLGEGTTFSLVLPLVAAEPEEADTAGEAAACAAPQEITLEGRRILLAEDNQINMEVATDLLSMSGAEIVQAWNGKEALDAFKDSGLFSFDAILMDMQMPVMNGCDAARKIRKLPRPDAGRIPIVALTANAFAEDIAATEEAGMDAHVSKPIDFTILCRTLVRLIRERGE